MIIRFPCRPSVNLIRPYGKRTNTTGMRGTYRERERHPTTHPHPEEVGTIVARSDTDTGTRRIAETASERDQLPLMLDRTTIAIESMRTQWRSIAHLGTHERMAISQLRVYGAMPMSELAARISLSRAAVTSLIDRLENENWVSREADELDRRRTVLRLRTRAVEAFDSVSSGFDEDLAKIAGSFSDEQWGTVASFLTRLAEVAERHARELRVTALERSLT